MTPLPVTPVSAQTHPLPAVFIPPEAPQVALLSVSSSEEAVLEPRSSPLFDLPGSWQAFQEKALFLRRYAPGLELEESRQLADRCDQLLFREPCLEREAYLMRLLELRQMVQGLEALPGAEELVQRLKEHLLHAEQALKLLPEAARGISLLHQRILQLPSLEPDPFGAAVAALQEKLPQLLEGEIASQLKELLPALVPASHYFLRGESDKLEPLLQRCRLLLHRLPKEETLSASLKTPLDVICQNYRRLLEAWESGSEAKRAALLEPRVQLSGVGLGFFSLSRDVACRLLSKNLVKQLTVLLGI